MDLSSDLRKALSVALTILLLAPVAAGQDVADQLNKISAGARIELRLKNRQTLRGVKGPVSTAGFTLIDTRKVEHQILFDDVTSVKQLKSHTTRNVLIVVAIGVAAIGITLGIMLRCGPLGCGRGTL